MKIECPNCKLSGNINENTVPGTGLAMTCPRCKGNFTANRPVAEAGLAGAQMDSCPSCQYGTFSEEKFSICPKCGLVVAEYFRQQLEARGSAQKRSQTRQTGKPAYEQPAKLSADLLKKEDEARRKYGLDKPPGNHELPEAETTGQVGTPPLAVMLVGWTSIIVAILLIIYGSSSLVGFSAKLKEAAAAIQAGEDALSGRELFVRFALTPLLTICYSLMMLLFASQFLRLKQWTLKAMEAGAWGGICLAGIMELTGMVTWCRRASENASWGYYATGILGGALMAALWIVPLLILAEYLKSEQFEKIRNCFR